MEKTEVININRTEKANNFSGRYAGVGSDFKIYFDTLEELKAGIDAIIAAKQHLDQSLKEEVN